MQARGRATTHAAAFTTPLPMRPRGRRLGLFGAAALVAALASLSLGDPARAAAPPTATAGASIATALPGTVAGSVEAGARHTCGTRANGMAACWGRNASGQAAPPAGTFAAVSGGGSHSCGVTTSGALACWGSDAYGQATPPAGTFTAVSAGGRHSCGRPDRRRRRVLGPELRRAGHPTRGHVQVPERGHQATPVG